MTTASLLRVPARRWSSFSIAAALLGTMMAVLVVVPLVSVLWEVMVGEPGSPSVLEVVEDTLGLPGLWEMLRNTAVIVLVSGSIALVIGSLFAWLNERTDAGMGWLSSVLPILPLLLPGIAASIGWVFLLAPNAGAINGLLRGLFGLEGKGPLNIFSWEGLIFLYSVELIPLVYLVVSAALRNLDPALEQASRIAGASPLTTLRKVTLPAVVPALASAAWLSLTVSLIIFSVPSVVGSTADISVLSVEIVHQQKGVYPSNTRGAIVLGVVMLLSIGAAWVIQRAVAQRGRHASVGGKGVRAAKVKLGGLKWPARVAMITFIAISSILPILGLVIVSLQKFWSANLFGNDLGFDAYRTVLLENPATQSAIVNSVRLGAIGATIAVTIALAVALFARQHPGRWATALDGFLKLPSAFSHIIVAIGIIVVFAGAPFYWTGTITILLIAYVIIYMPQASIAAGSATGQVDKQLVEASHISGAGDWRTIRSILLPLSLPGLAGGWALVFVYMSGDLTASVLLAGTKTPTAGSLILTEFTGGSYPTIAALGLVMSLTSTVVVLLVMRFSKGSLGARRA